ncbi:class D sortase [Sediminibacillus albus]|uniref:Sortase A n=1 Tax=Sediminibacillus albus TaxID=407036 RepID=A0A1G8YKX7_9BACI|nr:class D sortase [Sediminibacillus albus]SDK03522.1 sortase A [Sediminibacillus albus]
MKKISLLLMVAGLALLSYGFFQYVKAERAQQASLAEAHSLLDKGKNDSLINNGKKDLHPENHTAFLPSLGETVGILSIPKINAELPIVEGTDPEELEKGVGHYKGTAYPMENDQIVLSGHRDTVFRRMGEVEVGDIFIVELPYGQFRYQMESSKIVDAEDRSVIVSTAPKEVLTITTCYPFSYVGNAPERYIITAVPID